MLEYVHYHKAYAVASQHGFTSHCSSATGYNMWTRKDGTQYYYTDQSNKT